MRTTSNYMSWRALSAIGDEVWSVAFPIYFATLFTSSEIGLIVSCGGLGSLFGFVLASYLLQTQKASRLAIAADIGQVILFAMVALMLFFPPSIPAWSALLFGLSALISIWFSSSETLLARIGEARKENYHRLNVIAGEFGPLLGPALGGALVQMGMMIIVPLVNMVSFSGQVLATNSLSKSEQALPESRITISTWLERLLDALKLLMANRELAASTVIPVVVKVSLSGAIPFVLVRLTKDGLSPFIVSLIVCLFSAGSIAGAGLMKPLSKATFKASVILNTGTMLLLLGILMITLVYFPNKILFAVLFLLIGFFSARYTVGIRSLRQWIVPSEHMGTIVSLQAIIARTAMPLSGLLVGVFLLSENATFRELGWVFYGSLMLLALIALAAIAATKVRVD